MRPAAGPWPIRIDRLVRAAFWLAAMTLLAGTPLAAQAPTGSKTAISAGRKLEVGRRWTDALSHYQSAVEKWPNTNELKHGLRRSRIQCGIQHRYADRSFRQQLLGLPQRDAIGIFDDLLTRVRSSFVEPITLTLSLIHI